MADETYIKMVLALPPEFFKDWKINDGDKFWLTDDTDEWYVPSNEYEAYTIMDGKLVSHVVDPEDWIFASLDVGRPIPTQEQLQDMMKKYYRENRKWYMQEDPTDFELLQRFIEMLLCAPDASKGDSIKMMWLKCLVWEMYEKNWNGSSWV